MMRANVHDTFPEIATDTADPTEPASSSDRPWWYKCRGCIGNMARTRREHSRIRGECKYPDVTPEQEWTCPGCVRDPPRPRGHASHTESDGCRWQNVPARMSMQRNRAARSGMHPREARIPESASASADVPGPDLNEGIDEEIRDINRDTDAKEDDNANELVDEIQDDQPLRPRDERTHLNREHLNRILAHNSLKFLRRPLEKMSRTGQNLTLDAQFEYFALEPRFRSPANYASYIFDGGTPLEAKWKRH